MTQKALAAALGITQGRLSQLKAAGMPVDTIEGALAWRRARLDSATAKPGPRQSGRFDFEELRHRKLEFETALRKAQLERAELEHEVALGNLVAKEDAARAMRDVGTYVRVALENFADQVAPLVVMVDIDRAHEVLTEQCRLALTAISEQLRNHSDA